MLASLVIKIEYCRAFHRGSKEPSRHSLFLSAATISHSISGFSTQSQHSILSFSDAFLTETDVQTEIAVTLSKQTIATFLTETRIAQLAISNPRFSAPENRVLHNLGIQIFLAPTI